MEHGRGRFQRHQPHRQDHHGKAATATASWTFTGLATGSYSGLHHLRGQEHVLRQRLRSRVLDGGTTLGTVDVNESILVTQSQGGLTQGSYGGVGWLELGEFASSDGNLEVLLSNLAIGHFVDADGVLLVPVDPQVVIRNVSSPSSGQVAPAIGTLPPPATTAAASTKTASTGAQAISLAGVTQPIAVSVVYDKTPPRKGIRQASLT